MARVQVWSRPGEGDECDAGWAEHNGSFEIDFDLRTSTEEQREAWAEKKDCFQYVTFTCEEQHAMVEHSRTWGV